MTAPFIFVGTHRVKPGKREEFIKYFTEFCTGVVEPNEPRLHSFFGYTAPDSDLVTVVQVHPDAELAQAIAGASQGGTDAVTIREPFAGFSRLPSAEPRR